MNINKKINNYKKDYNQLVLKNNKYQKKLKKLIFLDIKEHRQSVLKQHITKLEKKIQVIISLIKRKVVLASFFSATMFYSSASFGQFFSGNPGFTKGGYGLENVSNLSADRIKGCEFVDMDADGDYDVFTFSDATNGLIYRENIGSSTSPNYDNSQVNPFGFSLNSIVTISTGDLDNDGDFDIILINNNGDFFYAENTGTTSSPLFSAPISSPFGLSSLGYSSYAIPELADIDNDGDLDIITNFYTGSIAFIENIGTITSPNFAPKVINPFNLTNNIIAPSLADLDNDGDLDIFASGSYSNILYYENIGNASAPQFSLRTENPFNISPGPVFKKLDIIDFDGDGDFEITGGSAGQKSEFFLFTNIGTNSNPDFTVDNRRISACFDIGDYIVNPEFADIDGDGDFDLFAGGSNLEFYENIGSSQNPIFGPILNNAFNLTNNNYDYVDPNIIDIDNDGDLDIFITSYYGSIVYYENIGTTTNGSFSSGINNPFGFTLTQTYYDLKFSFSDLDDDGDYDVLAYGYGYYTSGFLYFENTGTSTSPTFGSALTSPFLLTDPFYSSDYHNLAIDDIDLDGDLDLVVGDYYGNFNYFENIGNSTSPSFLSPISNPFGIQREEYTSTPVFIDIDDDGDNDLFSALNHLTYFERIDSINTFVEEVDNLEKLILAPNPAKNVLSILSNSELEYVEIFNIAGKKIINLKEGFEHINVGSLKTGVFIVKITLTDKTVITKKLIKE